MKVLMTGSHGFVGTNLIELLSDRYEIIRWDAMSNIPWPDVDIVIHLAGLAHDTKRIKDDKEYFKVNTELTKKIFDKFLETNAKKFIFFSSIKANDNDTPYARSKRLSEDYILSHTESTEKAFGQRKCVYILRPCMIHGKGMKGNLPLLVKWMNKGLPWPLAAFENKRSYASMGNVGYVVDELIKGEIPSGIYNVCDDDPVSTNELIELICQCVGKKARFLRIPKGMMSTLARMGDILHLPLSRERLGKLTEDKIVDNKDIKHSLGIERMPIDAKEGLRLSIMINQNRQE